MLILVNLDGGFFAKDACGKHPFDTEPLFRGDDLAANCVKDKDASRLRRLELRAQNLQASSKRVGVCSSV